MATKCITITNEAYEKLAAQKQGKESFSDVINRIIPSRSLLELAGILTIKEADEMKKYLQESRKRSEERINRIAEVMR